MMLLQVTEPADYSDSVADWVGGVAAQGWPIVLGLLVAVIGITLAVVAIRAGFRHVSLLVGGGRNLGGVARVRQYVAWEDAAREDAYRYDPDGVPHGRYRGTGRDPWGLG